MILGVDHNATDEEIRRAYKRMALIYHPDKNKHPRTTAQFRKINEAFNVLSDASARRKYDASVMLSRRPHTTNNSHNSGVTSQTDPTKEKWKPWTHFPLCVPWAVCWWVFFLDSELSRH